MIPAPFPHREATFLVIQPGKSPGQFFHELYKYRELFYFLAWRDTVVRYKQAFFGIGWALLRPVLNMAIFTLIFGKIAHLHSENIPYPLYVLAGMLPWQLVSGTMTDTSNVLLLNVQLITKVYFPRLILTTSQIFVQFIDFCINLLLIFVLMLLMPAGNLHALWALPLFTLLTLALCLGLSLWLSALTVQYRDFRFIATFMVQFGLFLSPIGYGSFLIPETWRWLYFLNPMVGIIDGFRWALFGVSMPALLWSVSMSIAATSAILLGGLYYFQKTERTFADRI